MSGLVDFATSTTTEGTKERGGERLGKSVSKNVDDVSPFTSPTFVFFGLQ